MIASRDPEFPIYACWRSLCVLHLAKDRRLGLNVFANQLCKVFATDFIVFSGIVDVSTGAVSDAPEYQSQIDQDRR
jgi:hypothetical protein